MTENAPTTARPGTRAAVEELATTCAGCVHLPGTDGYDQGRAAWNAAADQRPAAVATPHSVEEIRSLVLHGTRLGLRLAPQATGHGAGVLARRGLDDVVLLRTHGLRAVHVDPVSRTARAEAGATWEDVVAAAAAHGLTALHGSAPDVGVVGYTLGGGLGWFARQHGLAVNSVVGVEVVTPAGEVVRADEENNPDLFWAIRGGGGNFGIVTTIEMRLFDVPDAWAGMMVWEGHRAPEVLRHFAAWSVTAPEQVTASFRILRFPPLPDLPDFLSGRTVVALDGASTLPDGESAALFRGFRALAPELDTFGRVPSAALVRLHMDPEQPTPTVGGGVVLRTLGDGAVQAFLDLVGPGAETGVFMAELRQLGGAVSRPSVTGGALDHLDGSHVALFVAVAPTPETARLGAEEIEGALTALQPWQSDQVFQNFADQPVDAHRIFEADTWERLQEVRAKIDPAGALVAHHAVGD